MNRKINYANKYVPQHAGHGSLLWYERDGLMSYIDALKYEQFQNDPQGHFERTRVINFEIIQAQARGEYLDKKTEDSYKTVQEKDSQDYSYRHDIVAPVIQSRRKDLHLEKGLVVKHFKKQLYFFFQKFRIN